MCIFLQQVKIVILGQWKNGEKRVSRFNEEKLVLTGMS